MYDPYFKRSVAPIRENVTFIPFRIGGTAGSVTGHGHGDCQNVLVG